MGNFKPEKIRNICFAGHGRSGKTTLCEAMLFHAGAVDRYGSTADGTATMDYDPEETKRNFSISTAVAPLTYKDVKINLIDTPGYFDFVGGVFEGMKGADSVVVTVSGKSGVGVGTEQVFRYAVRAKLPIAMFITKLENEHSDYDGILEQIKSRFGAAIVPFTIPVIENKKVVGFADVVSGKAYAYDGFQAKEIPMPDAAAAAVESARDTLYEQIAETDEALMEKYFDGQAFSNEEIRQGIKAGLKESIVIPVFAGELATGAGVSLFMDAVVSYLPSPVEANPILATDSKTEDIIELKASESDDLAAVVFKTVADPYVGKLSIFRVVSGVMKSDTTVYNPVKNWTALYD